MITSEEQEVETGRQQTQRPWSSEPAELAAHLNVLSHGYLHSSDSVLH
jgi:hypothetical protein